MSTSMMSAEIAQKLKKKNQIKKGLAAMLGLLSVLSFFLPYIRFVFKDMIYSVSGYQLLTTRGMRVVGPKLSGLVTIPLLTRIAVLLGVLLALAGVLLLLFKKPVAAGFSFLISAVTPMIVLITTSSIQEAVTQLNISRINIGYLYLEKNVSNFMK
jgi:hypothetical protein